MRRQSSMVKDITLTDAVYLCMKNGHYWTFWELQETIKSKTNRFYGEPTISAAIRNLRKEKYRSRYGLGFYTDPVSKKRIAEGKGYKYKLTIGEK